MRRILMLCAVILALTLVGSAAALADDPQGNSEAGDVRQNPFAADEGVSDTAADEGAEAGDETAEPPDEGQQAEGNEEEASDETAPLESPYTLRYKFAPGETVRWQVEHRSNIRTTIQGTTQSAESVSGSVKLWRVTDVDDEGIVSFEHSVESVSMRQKLSGRTEVSYDSLTDKEPPAVFAEAAKSVGVTLAVFKMDARGKIVERENKLPNQKTSEEAQMAIQFPEKAVAIGDKWNHPYEIEVASPGKKVMKIKARQQYTLTEVTNGVATIKTETQILTPIRDPAIEAQLAQRENSGEVRFDIVAGRIVSQQFDLEKSVVGFSGEQSSLQCRTRFNETLLEDAGPTAGAGGPGDE